MRPLVPLLLAAALLAACGAPSTGSLAGTWEGAPQSSGGQQAFQLLLRQNGTYRSVHPSGAFQQGKWEPHGQKVLMTPPWGPTWELRVRDDGRLSGRNISGVDTDTVVYEKKG